jgi:hypothetical protein
MAPAPARRNQQVLLQMPRKALQDRMRPALRVHRLRQARVEALDRNGDSPHTPPRVVAGSPRILAQELQDLLPLPPRLRLHWLDGQLIIQHRFKRALLPAQVPDGLRIVQPQRLFTPASRRGGSDLCLLDTLSYQLSALVS